MRRPASRPTRPVPVARLPIPQVVGVNDVSERPLLPSFLYLPAAEGVPAGGLDLPWKSPPDRVVGVFARDHGAKVPGRLVSSAKSWLSHAGVDRRAAILPWTAAEDVAKVSPVAASSAYLEHLRDAWNARIAGKAGGRSAGEPGRLLDRAGLVRRRRARADQRGRRQGRAPAGDPDRGAAGRLLRLARRAGRPVAEEGEGRRHHPRLRRRRRDDRLHPDRRERRGGRPGPLAPGRRRAHPARRRQHGPRPGLCRGGHAARRGWRASTRRSGSRWVTPAAPPRRRSSST